MKKNKPTPNAMGGVLEKAPVRKKARKISSKRLLVCAEPPLIIENISPELDGGTHSAKAVQGAAFMVEADFFKDGHQVLGGALLYRNREEKEWHESPLVSCGNDRWRGFFTPEKNDVYFYTIRAWVDALETWMQFMIKKCSANTNVQSDLMEGVEDLKVMERAASEEDRKILRGFRKLLELSAGASDEVIRILRDEKFNALAARYTVRKHVSEYPRHLELVVDRRRAVFAAWYELFPRSQGIKKGKSGTFQDCIRRLPEIKKMGFDVVYLPPIHPIGVSHRKGPNNTLNAPSGSPGSPWAIGSSEGGHKSVHPELGTLEDFKALVKAAERLGMEIALDLAYQCSPDHPYVREHPDWFYRLPDGTIRYAENPPKKYQDIYPLDFHCADWPALWEELKSVVLFWMAAGVRTFRVDNPHTKPLGFWKWLIDEIREAAPDVIFLAEAFTRPKVMRYLAKAGFTQSYTYFTWRNHKWDLREYAEELTQGPMKHYFRGNFFANTPDILHEYLQKGGRPAFKIRAVLAATLSSVYGIYSGYELCENRPLHEGSEEYLDSEKYQIRRRDWNAAGNIKDYIARINRVRQLHPALQEYANLSFYESRNDNILCYGKKTLDNSDIIVVVVNLNPHQAHEDLVRLPIWEFGLEDWQTYQMHDLITGEKYHWKGCDNYIRLDPGYEPAHLFHLKK